MSLISDRREYNVYKSNDKFASFQSSIMILVLQDISTFQVLVIDYKLTYPSGTATAVLINGFHTKQGDKNAKYGFQFITPPLLGSYFRLWLDQASLDDELLTQVN
jgi:hypothetical protein